VKVTYPTQELLGQLQGMVALQDPASHCLLPLSSDSSEYLHQLAREARDRCEAAAELPDFAQMRHDLQSAGTNVGLVGFSLAGTKGLLSSAHPSVQGRAVS